MADEFTLKSISREGVGVAIERAEHYRLLNDPWPAESICLDVLAVDPDNQKALVVLILALTDQFIDGGSAHAQEAKSYIPRLKEEYDRHYYTGLVFERQARAYIARGKSSVFAYDTFMEAMASYEKAESIRPAGNDDAILRWNSCVRTIQQQNLEPLQDEGELPLE